MSYLSRAVGASFGPTVGGQSKLATPGRQKKREPEKKKPGKVWATTLGSVEWMAVTGSPVGPVTFPPDPDTLDDASLYPGASDGTSQYLLALGDDTDGTFYVDKFDHGFTTLVDRWQVPGWFNSPASGMYTTSPSYNVQHVSASTSLVVAIIDLFDPDITDPVTGSDTHYIGVAVFNTAGTVVDQYQIYTTVDLGGGDFTEGSILTGTGSFCDGSFVYFAHGTASPDGGYAKVNLSSGTLTDLFAIDDVNALAPDDPWITAAGVVVVGGDLIVVGADIARIQQDGTPVWFAANPNHVDVPTYQALALSGRNSVWSAASPDGFSSITHEFSFAGTFLKASAWTETVDHTWLGPN